MMQSPRTIVVGVGTITEEDPVLAAAGTLAEALGAAVYAIHAFELPPVFGYSYRMRYTYPDSFRRYRSELQAKLAEQVGRLPGAAQIQHRVFEGPPAQVLTAVAARVEADLVLVGATRRGALGRTFLGTTAERVMRTATAPVLVMRRPIHLPLRRVLLATNLSGSSAQVRERARAIVEPLSVAAELRALLVVWYEGAFPQPLSDLARQRLLQSAGSKLEAFLAETQRGARPIEGRVRIGEPVREILAEAAEWKADLIVLGTFGRSTPHRFLLGSVAEATIRRATGNVLVVPVAPPAPGRQAAGGLGAPRTPPRPP